MECSSGSAFLVNAEVDSMGGFLDGGVEIGIKASPHRAAIENAQSELRQEFDVRDERRRELEFLVNGGDPLDFKLGQKTSVSVQSSSQKGQDPKKIVTSAAKDSSFTVSPLGDSGESSGRPGGPNSFEPNSADNLLLFEVENELLEGGTNSTNPSRRNINAISQKSSKMDGRPNGKGSENLAIFRPYARRNRSRSNRDGARFSSTDVTPSRGGHAPSLPARHSLKDMRGSILETNNNLNDQNKSSISNTKSASTNVDPFAKSVVKHNPLDMELSGRQETSAGLTEGGVSEDALCVRVPKDTHDNEQNGLLEVDASLTVIDMSPEIRSAIVSLKEVVSAGFECSRTSVARTQNENEDSFYHLSGCSSPNRDKNRTQNEDQISCAAVSTENFDFETTSNETSLTLKKNNEGDFCIITGNAGDNISPMDHMLVLERTGNLLYEVMAQGMNETKPANDGVIANDDHDCVSQNHEENDSIVRVEEDLHTIGPGLQFRETHDCTVTEADGKPDSNSKPDKEISSTTRTQGNNKGSSICEVPDATSSGREPFTALDLQNCSNRLEVANKAHEDSILDEARTIEAKRKRISELSVGSLVLENRGKSHWDFVLEEMTWLANDFAQERLWKITGASQISKLAVSTSQSRFDDQIFHRKQKKVALTLAKAVTSFWRSVEASVTRDNPSLTMKSRNFVQSASDCGYEVDEGKFGEPNIVLERRKDLEVEHSKLAPIKEYAVRFLINNRSIVSSIHMESSLSPERVSDLGIQETLLEDHFTEQSLFYKVSSGAVQRHRKSIEFCLIQCEKTGSSMQEEVDTSMYDAFEELSQMNKYDEEDAETSMHYYQGGLRGNKPSKLSQKKRQNLARAYSARSYEIGADFPYEQGTVGSHQSILLGKRPSNNLNVVSIPTKRMRTASRQRVQSLHSAGATGRIQAPNTDASSGDTNSYPDDQSTFYSGPQLQKSLEVESVVDFERLLPFDSGEIPTKPKKKKKTKHLSFTHEQRWQLDSVASNEQRDNSKKRLDSHHLESNGSSGLFGKHNVKRPKLMKQALDNTFHNVSPINGSMASPVASQMSNMSNTTKFMKLIAGRDQCRKTKMLMISSGQPSSGNPWSLFEDQELVVLVHDMGPNWELVSDVINSTLQFKCIFRNPKECKERHKSLMDTTAGDGADSAEDSGSSQPYRTTLTGIPKGGARQLFQRLQGPMEVETLKSHFEKIIIIGERLHGKNQVDNQDLKQVAPVHNSHIMALSQVCPNNLNGGFLSPLDLCDASASSPDILSHGYQSHVSSALSITNQVSSGANSSLQGSSSKVLSSNVSSPSGPNNASVRDGRYGGPRASLPIDGHPRLQQYNPTISGRNVQQSSSPASGVLSGTERGTRTILGGNGMGLLGGLNRSMPMSRPGFQGVASSSVRNSGSMLSSGMVAMPSPGTVHPGSSTGQGNPMLQPREAMRIMRPGQNLEHQRQMMLPELQMQATQGNSQGVPFKGLSSNFSNQTASPAPTYPVHSPQQHQMSSQQSHVLQNSHIPHHQQAMATRHPAYSQFKERQHQQQRMMQHQQHQFSASNALMQNSQIQQTSQPLSVPSLNPSSPMTPMSPRIQLKPNLQPHGIGGTPQTGASGLNSQTGKPRQRLAQHQLQQSGRQHPQRQQLQSQPQAKILKGIERGNMLINQNVSIIDPSHLNGISMDTGSQVAEKGETVMHMMQGQGLYSGSGLNSAQPTRPIAPQSSSQSHMQQNLFPVSSPPLSKQTQQVPSHSDNGSQDHGQSVPSGDEGQASSQVSLPSAMIPNHHHHQQSHLQTHQKHVNQIQSNIQRVHHQNRQGNSDLPNNSQVDQPHPDQKPVNSNSHTGSVKPKPQVRMESTHVTPTISSSSDQWKASDPVYHPIQPINQSIVQKQFSGSLPPQTHALGKQWQQQPRIKNALGEIPPTHQRQQEQERVESQQEESRQLQDSAHKSQQQMQHLQSGQDSLYIRPTNS